MNAIEIKNLTKIFKKDVRAVTDFSLSIPEATIFGLVGPNGAGKSTIMNILAGILKKTEGNISILGHQINSDDYQYKREVGFVLDRPHYIEKLTIKEYLHFCGAMYEIEDAETASRANELIHFFGLLDKKDARIASCSTGMKKKVSLAAALIHQPRLLILDEPLEGIDPVSVRQIKDNLRYMAEKGVTVLISSHNMDAIEKLCDRVAIINKGQLVFESRTEDIRKKMKDEMSRKTYQSLEEIFVDLVTDRDDGDPKKLSWL